MLLEKPRLCTTNKMLMQYLFTQLQSNMWLGYVIPSVEMGQFFFDLKFFVEGKKFLGHTG